MLDLEGSMVLSEAFLELIQVILLLMQPPTKTKENLCPKQKKKESATLILFLPLSLIKGISMVKRTTPISFLITSIHVLLDLLLILIAQLNIFLLLLVTDASIGYDVHVQTISAEFLSFYHQ